VVRAEASSKSIILVVNGDSTRHLERLGSGSRRIAGNPQGDPVQLKAGFAVLRTADLGCWPDQGLRGPRRSVVTLPGDNRTMSSTVVSAMATPRAPEVQSA
jgi:hypothetical protein